MKTIYVSYELMHNDYFESYEKLGLKEELEKCTCGLDVDRVLDEYHLFYEVSDMGDYYIALSEDDVTFYKYVGVE